MHELHFMRAFDAMSDEGYGQCMSSWLPLMPVEGAKKSAEKVRNAETIEITKMPINTPGKLI